MNECNTLHIDSIQKNYGDRKILSDVFLQCKTGDIIGLFGRNGSGKTTLLQIVYGLVPANDQYVAINGIKIQQIKHLRSQIGYLPQKSFIPINLTVLKVLKLSVSPEVALELKSDQVIGGLLRSKISQLSTGEKRYLECLIVLAKETKFVVLDEPFSSLSPLMIGLLKYKLTTCAEQKGIILTDHSYQNVLDVANKMMLILEGRLHRIESTSELVELGYLSTNMLELHFPQKLFKYDK
jgi:ABC-type lipopolysaccharide export system ATPase subunit